MTEYENIIIGFGKGGKTLANELASKGESVAIIEKDPQMYGGTCLNVACIPTKALEYAARMSAAQKGDFSSKSIKYTEAIAQKNVLIEMLRSKTYGKAISSGIDVITGNASFIDPTTISVTHPDGSTDKIYGKRFFINTGSEPIIPSIEGLSESAYKYTSRELLSQEKLPKQLVVIGGGYIGLEFSSMFANFGSNVTVIQGGDKFIPREDSEIADAVFKSFSSRGINILKNASVQSVKDDYDCAVLSIKTPNGIQTLKANAILVATGRRASTDDLNLSAAGVNLNSRGEISVDERLRTNVSNIWAVGDVKGGMQFTYISLDDFRIIHSYLFEDGSRTTANRGAIPYTVFIDPPLSRVGLSEEEAKQKGYNIKIARMAASSIPKAHILHQTEGLLKVIIDSETDMILGAHFFCVESQEMINIIKLCIDEHIPYTTLRDNIFNHPTMSESLNELLFSID